MMWVVKFNFTLLALYHVQNDWADYLRTGDWFYLAVMAVFCTISVLPWMLDIKWKYE